MSERTDFTGVLALFFNASSLWPYSPLLMQTATNLTGFLYDNIHCEHDALPVGNQNYLLGVQGVASCSCHKQFYDDYQTHGSEFLHNRWKTFDDKNKDALIKENLPALYFLCRALKQKDILSVLPQMNLDQNHAYAKLCNLYF